MDFRKAFQPMDLFRSMRRGLIEIGGLLLLVPVIVNASSTSDLRVIPATINLGQNCDVQTCNRVKLDDQSPNIGNVLDTQPTNGTKTTLYWGSAIIWRSDNDGPGSGLDADALDGNDSAAFASAVHDHDERYVTHDQGASQFLGRTAQASDSDRLDGLDSTAFANASHDHDGRYLAAAGKAADSDSLDGVDSQGFLRSDRSGTLAGSLAVTGALSAGNLLAKTYSVGGCELSYCYYTLPFPRAFTSPPTLVCSAGPHANPTYGVLICMVVTVDTTNFTVLLDTGVRPISGVKQIHVIAMN